MENENSKKITEIDAQIKALNKEKEEIQSKCIHKETKVKLEIGTNTPKLYCSVCNKEIGYPSREQLNDFLD
jgi:hypothetical protein